MLDCQWAARAAFVMAILEGVRQIVGLHWAAGGPSHLLLDCGPQKVVINSDQVADDAPSETMAAFYMTVAWQRKVCSTSRTSREFSSGQSLSFKKILDNVVFPGIISVFCLFVDVDKTSMSFKMESQCFSSNLGYQWKLLLTWRQIFASFLFFYYYLNNN